MTHTLWRGSELLGEGELGPAPGAAGAVAGPFRATPEFAAVWPVFGALQAAIALTMHALGALPPGAAADEIRTRLIENDPDNASGVALGAIEALGLEVRDAEGRVLRDVRALVGSWTFPVLDDLTAEQRIAAERDAAAVGVVFGVPNYVLTVVPRPPGPARAEAPARTRADGSAGAI